MAECKCRAQIWVVQEEGCPPCWDGDELTYPQACLVRPGLVKPFVVVLARDPVELSNEGENSHGKGGAAQRACHRPP